jgi:hypothetical protein
MSSQREHRPNERRIVVRSRLNTMEDVFSMNGHDVASSWRVLEVVVPVPTADEQMTTSPLSATASTTLTFNSAATTPPLTAGAPR